jgi:hypothetical protein
VYDVSVYALDHVVFFDVSDHHPVILQSLQMLYQVHSDLLHHVEHLSYNYLQWEFLQTDHMHHHAVLHDTVKNHLPGPMIVLRRKSPLSHTVNLHRLTRNRLHAFYAFFAIFPIFFFRTFAFYKVVGKKNRMTL